MDDGKDDPSRSVQLRRPAVKAGEVSGDHRRLGQGARRC